MGGLDTGFLLLFLGVIGTCIGSFLNVVAYRLPRECMSIVRPRSRCPSCAAPIAARDNVPVVSWLLLRGRCRSCGAPIKARYPLVELGTGLLFVLLAALVLPEGALRQPLGHVQEWVRYLVMALVSSALVALTLIDLDYRILPDEITVPGIVLGPFLAALAPGVQPSLALSIPGPAFVEATRWLAFANGVVGMVAAGGLLWLIGWIGSRLARKDAMGLGDVKMIAAMGGLLGLWALLSLAVAAVIGAVVGIVVRLVTRERYIPFGPFLALGTWLVMVRGKEILALWLGLFR